MKTLPSIFYTMPEVANTIMTREDLRELLLTVGDTIIACGRLYTIVPTRLGAGVYKVVLKRTN